MSASIAHRDRWALVGPWYRWEDPYDPDSGRASRPVFQKYDSPKLVDEFLADPQRSLRFQPEDDFHEVQGGQWTRTELRKIYLDTHRRFYLVVCELHCDAAGFPSARRGDVCEAGFVVRRRTVSVPAGAAKPVGLAFGALAAQKAKLAQIQALGQQTRSKQVQKSVTKALEGLQQAQATLAQTAKEHDLKVQLQGWFASEFDGLGEWRSVEERAEVVEELVHPLTPLVPDPAIGDHSSAGRTLFFGLLPTGSADADAAGYARFDDRTLYEVRCFVRRRREGCVVKRPAGRCKGEVVWSAPTEGYRLASHFDLLGTSNRPVNIQMPDLPAIKAQVDTVPLGRRAPVRMIAPDKSGQNLQVDAENPGASQGSLSAQICCFAIPLITFVATFVLKLFLPIVLFVFQLWWMLRLKFCIPPSIGIDAGLAASLTADPGGVELQADAKLSVLGAELGTLPPGSDPPFTADEDGLPLSARAKADLVLDASADFSASAPADIDIDKHPDTPHDHVQTLPSAEAGLEYEAPVPLP